MLYLGLSYGTVATNNDGNITAIAELVGNKVPWASLTQYNQSFTYDNLNRLASASETETLPGGSPTSIWSRTFAYDQYGNAWVPSLSGIGYGVSTPEWDVYNSANNRVNSSPYTGTGAITALPPAYSFSYDGENRVTSETNSNGPSAAYYYDGLGERVVKVSGSTTTVYVYYAFGNLAEEYSPYNVWSTDYIFLGGQAAAIENATASPCGTCFLSRDQLGTVRMVTDVSTNIITRHDYLPFGDEIQAGWAGRSSQFGSGADNVNQKFTGQFRDPETLNDAFPARYYTAPLMRFLTPDPAGAAAVDPSDPQTWNQYAYVRNNALSNVDPTGMACEGLNDASGAYTQCMAEANMYNGGDLAQGGTCIADGGPVNCTALSSEAGVVCPAGDCSIFNQPVIRTSPGGNQTTYWLVATTQGVGYMNSSDWGDLISDAGELGLPNIGAFSGGPGGAGGPQNNAPDKRSCASRLAAGVQKNTGVTPTNLQYTGKIGGHASYTFEVSDPTGFQSILNQNTPWSWAAPLDEGHRYGIVMSTHILDPVNGGPFSGHTDLFNGHSVLAPLHWIVDVGIGHIPGVNLDFGCKAGS